MPPEIAEAPEGARRAAQPTAEGPLVEARDLRKSFGPTRAVDGVSFDIRRGEILGFLGPNGAGKTTTLKMITGFHAWDGGGVTVCGHDVATETLDARRRIGYLPESLPLYWEMRVDEYLEFMAESRQIPRAERRRRIDEAIEMLGLGRMRKRLTGSLSKGFRQRVGLAQALIHDPEILILDEPTNGLDPQQIIEIRELLKRLARDKAIIFSTHILQEISAICSRVMIIRDGRLIANGTPEELAERVGGVRWELVLRGEGDGSTEGLDELGLGRLLERTSSGEGALLRFDGAAGEPDLARVLARGQELGLEVEQVRRPQRSLEDVYLRLTGDGKEV